MAEQEEVVITRHGKPAGVLVGFASDDDWFDYQLEKRPAVPSSHRARTHKPAAGQGSQARRRLKDEKNAEQKHEFDQKSPR